MDSELDLRERIIVALDYSYKEDVKKLVSQVGTDLKFVKVGMELYYSAGPDIVKFLKDKNLKVFLDLKLHDIPTTVFKAMNSIIDLGVEIINIHALGGIDMMCAAKGALIEALGDYDASMSGRPSSTRPFLIAVTQLTSTDQTILNNEIGIQGSVEDSVLHLASQVKEANLDGVVCSPKEVKMLKEKFGKDFITVTPGIRPKSVKANEQKRVTTPYEAIELGTDYMVIGRAITHSDDPQKAFAEIVSEIQSCKL